MAETTRSIDGTSLPPLWTIATGSLVLLYLVSVFRSYWRLRHVPGPWLGAVSELWYIRAATSGELHLRLAAVCKKYGGTARIGPNTVITDSENFIRKANAARGEYRRGYWYSAFKFDADFNNVFSETDEEKHTAMRTKLASGYSGKDNPDLEPSIDRTVQALLDLIEKTYADKKRVDFALLINYFTLDTITSLMLSKPFGWLEQDEDMYQYIEVLEASFPVMNLISAVPALSWLMRQHWVQKLAFPSPKDKTGMGRVKGACRELAAARINEGKTTKQDMMQSMINHGCDLQQVADESMLAILAGSDTTSTTIRMTLLHLLSTPTAYQKLYLECSQAKVPFSSIISHKEALKLPYLQATWHEGLRVFPPATGLSPKVAPPGGDVLDDGTYIPGGTQVGIAAFLLFHDKSVYGEDSRIFRPERWIEASEDDEARMNKNLELMFSHGRFKCLGQKVAVIELSKVIFELIRRYDWALENPMKPMETSKCYGLFCQRGMWVTVKRREPSVHQR